MIEKLFTYANIVIDRIQIREAFYMILYMSIFAVIVGFTIYLIQEIFDKKISPKWKVVMWGIFILSLIVPLNINGIYESSNIFMKSLNPIQEISFKQEVDERQAEYNAYIQRQDTTFEEYKVVRGNLYTAYAKYIVFDIVIPCLWIGVIGILLLRYLWLRRKMNRLSVSDLLTNKRILGIFEETKKELNIKKDMVLINKKGILSPAIYGIANAKIFLDEDNVKEKTDKEIQYILMHELSHYQGKDLILNFVLNLLKTIYWFNPFLYVLFKRMRQDMELKADANVLKHLKPEENKEYAMTIINALRDRLYKSYKQEVLNLAGVESDTERRIYMIKFFPKFKAKPFRITIISLTLMLIIGSIFFIGNIAKVEENYFAYDYEDMIPYKIQYVGDFNSVKNLVQKLSLGNYAQSIFTRNEEENPEQYYLEIHYYTNYIVEEKNREYEIFKELPLEKKEELFKKNAVTLLSLIDNLHAVEVIAHQSDYDSDVVYEKTYEREELEKEYGVDLRTYTYNPDNFPFEEDLVS